MPTAAESLALRGKATTLIVVQPQGPAAELLLQDAVLVHEVVDELRLLPVDPAA
jgi:hypothetical protein